MLEQKEEKLIIWSVTRLSKEFKISQRKLSRLFKALGAKRYTNSTFVYTPDS